MTGTDGASPILDAQGRPMARSEETRSKGRQATRAEMAAEIAAASMTGVRRVWNEAIARDLTPARLAQLMRAAADGDADAYLALAEEMEELDLHYGSVLGTRKRALSGIAPRVEAASDRKRDQEIAEAVRKLVDPIMWPNLVEDLLDGLGKGYSVVEMLWNTAAKPWKPRAYEHRDPRWFRYDDVTRRRLLLRDESVPDGIPLPTNKFIVFEPKLKTGIPIRGGLARLVAWSFMFKHYTVLDWVQFVETYGMPLRIGRYQPGASAADMGVLRRAVMGLARDAAAILPEGMRIEFEQIAASGQGWEVFRALAEYLDKQVSKAVLGQTMTADDGASLAQAKIHNEVRLDIMAADARQITAVINRDLVVPFVDLNFGPPPNGHPLLLLAVPEPEDTKMLVEALQVLVPMGLEVEASVIRDKLGLPDPPPPDQRGPEVVLLRAPAQAMPPVPSSAGPPASPPEPGDPADPAAKPAPGDPEADPKDAPDPQAENAKATNRGGGDEVAEGDCTCPGCGSERRISGLDRAMNFQGANPGGANPGGGDHDVRDTLEEEALAGWREVVAPLIDPVVAAIEGATGYGDALARLAGLAGRMDDSALMASLTRATFAARAAGDADDPGRATVDADEPIGAAGDPSNG